MQYFQEITEWATPGVVNGAYYLSDDKTWMVAYRAPGHGEYKYFKRPIRLDKRGRKFKQIGTGEPDSKYITASPPIGAPAQSIQVQGSNGAIYHVSGSGNRMSCSCPGFQFRRKCRHIETAGLP